MKKIIERIWLLLIIPLMPIVIIIDVLIGDIMTGTKTTVLEKIKDHYRTWIKLWCRK